MSAGVNRRSMAELKKKGKSWRVHEVTGRINAFPDPATMLLVGSELIGLTRHGRKKLFKR